jgi:hypothetical protein
VFRSAPYGGHRTATGGAMAAWQVVLLVVLIAGTVTVVWIAARARTSRPFRVGSGVWHPPPPDPPSTAAPRGRSPGGPRGPTPPEPSPVPRRPVPPTSPGGPTPTAAVTPRYGSVWYPSGIFGNLAHDRWRSSRGEALFVQLEVEELPGAGFLLRRRSVRAADDVADRILGRVHSVIGQEELDASWPPVIGEWDIPPAVGISSEMYVRRAPLILRDLLMAPSAGSATTLPTSVRATLSAYLREIARPLESPMPSSATPFLYVAGLAIGVGTDRAAVRLACARSLLRETATTLAAALVDRDDGTPALMPRAPTPVHAR